MKLLFYLLAVGLFFFNLGASAQIKPIYTQYMLNQYLLNPAVAGIQDYWDIKASARYQWVGIDGYPRSLYTSVQGPVKKVVLNESTKKGDKKLRPKDYEGDKFFHGLGGLIHGDRTGPTTVLSAYGSYAFNMRLARNIRLALGIAPGIQNFTLNAAYLNIENTSDQSILVPDLTSGLWLYNPKFYVGFSGHQLLESRLNKYNFYYDKNKLYRHLFFTLGYRFDIHKELHIVPAVMLRYIGPYPVDLDLSVKTFLNNKFWAGVLYRPVSSSFAGMVGFNFDKKIDVSYAYDYYNSYLNTISYGTHEIVVGYRLITDKRVHSPSDFW